MVNSPSILRKPSQNSLPSSLALTLKWPLAKGEVVLLCDKQGSFTLAAAPGP